MPVDGETAPFFVCVGSAACGRRTPPEGALRHSDRHAAQVFAVPEPRPDRSARSPTWLVGSPDVGDRAGRGRGPRGGRGGRGDGRRRFEGPAPACACAVRACGTANGAPCPVGHRHGCTTTSAWAGRRSAHATPKGSTAYGDQVDCRAPSPRCGACCGLAAWRPRVARSRVRHTVPGSSSRPARVERIPSPRPRRSWRAPALRSRPAAGTATGPGHASRRRPTGRRDSGRRRRRADAAAPRPAHPSPAAAAANRPPVAYRCRLDAMTGDR
ncbi:MAG: hypothetical protein QOK30_1001 [Nocardioidaceae bacterium]|nr:hypothetical protein [Nocardioidaceae bacterium]